MATNRADFLKSFKNFRSRSITPPTTPPPPEKPSETNEQAVAPGQQSLPVSQSTNPPPPNTNLLPDLHITANDLADGLVFASQIIKKADLFDFSIDGARDLLHTVSRAFTRAFPERLSDDLPEMISTLRNDSWAPSLDDLLSAGLTTKALEFMPAGIAQVKMPPGGETFPMLPKDLWTLQHTTELTPGDYELTIDTVAMMLEAFAGSTVKAWAVPKGSVQ